MLPRFQPASREQESWLLCGFVQTSGQTGSGFGNAKASGHGLPLFRPLISLLPCCPQARLRTFPILLVLGMRGVWVSWIKVGSQKRRIEIPLHRPDATPTLVNPLREGLFQTEAAAVTILREFGTACGNFVQGAARACNGASQHVYKHPWSAKLHTFAVLFLPRLIADLFKDDGVAHGDHLMDKPPMQALAMPRKPALLALPSCAASSGRSCCCSTPASLSLLSCRRAS